MTTASLLLSSKQTLNPPPHNGQMPTDEIPYTTDSPEREDARQELEGLSRGQRELQLPHLSPERCVFSGVIFRALMLYENISRMGQGACTYTA